jgi:hypothetical protein
VYLKFFKAINKPLFLGIACMTDFNNDEQAAEAIYTALTALLAVDSARCRVVWAQKEAP